MNNRSTPLRSFLSVLALAAPMALLSIGTPACNFAGDHATDGGTTFDGFGSGQAAVLAAAASSQDFGTVDVGAQSASAAIVIDAVGSGSTGSLAVSLGGADADSFGIDADGCSGQTLGGGASCTLHVHFAPKAAAAEAATLTVSGQQGGSATVALSGKGATPGKLTMGPGTQDFGAVPAGGISPATTFTLTNGDAAPSGAVTLALTGADLGEFQIVADTCSGKTLAGKATCTAGITFAPASVGSKTATLTATAQGLAGTATASLSGSAVPPASFSVKPAQFDFGAIVQGSPTAEQTFTVTNVGGAASGAAGVTVTGPSAADFTLTSNDCTAPVPQGGACTFGLKFLPSAAASESATVEIVAPSIKPVSVAVSGTGLAPAAIDASPATLDMGPLAQGTTGPDAPFVVTNHGSVLTGALSVALGGSNADQFGLGADGCTGQMLAPGATCTVDAHFAPTASGTLGSVQASLQVTGAPGGTTAAGVTGTAVAPATLVLGTSSQGFGTVVQQQTSGDFPITVTNTGGVPSGPLTATLGGTSAAQFGIGSNDCGNQPLAAAATCTVNVHFSPDATALGLEQASLTVTATPGGSPVATLTGTAAVPAALVVSPTSYPFGNIVQGSASADVAFTVTNTGGVSTGALTTGLGGTNVGQFGLGPDKCVGQMLPPGGTCTVSAHFTPSLGTLGAQQATLAVTGAPGGTGITNLIGVAATPLAVSPATQAFGTGAFGSPSAALPFIVTNSSAVAVGPLTVSLQGANANQFQLGPASNCDKVTLTPGGTCTVTIALSPTSGTTGPMTATLSVSAGPNTAQTAALTGTAAASATLAFGAASQSFGTVVQQNSSGDIALAVKNTGGVPSGALAAATLTGADAAQFGIVSDGCAGKTLASAATCSVTVHFAPGNGAVGTKSATLAVTATPGGAPSIALSGTAVAPAAIGITPSAHAFGDTVQGATASDFAFTVTNSGGAATGSLQAASLSAGSPFQIRTDGCKGTSIAASGGTCSVTVYFAPPLGTSGVQQDTLTVSDPAGKQSTTASVTGNATTPLAVSTPTAGFGNAAVGSPSAPVTFTVTNLSPTAVGPLSVALQGSDAAQFKLGTNHCDPTTLATLPGKGTCTVDVTLSPTGSVTTLPAAVALKLVVTGNANASISSSATLGGTIVRPATLTFNTTSQDFGTVVQNATSNPIVLTLTNGGDVRSGTLTTTSPLGGTNPTLFGLVTDACNGQALDPQAKCQISVRFAPGASAPGSYSANLTVGGAPGGAPSVGLSGNVVKPAALTVSSTTSGPSSSIAWDFGPTPQGSRSPVTTFTVANSGGVDTGTLGDTIPGGAFQIVTDNCNGKPLPVGQSCTILAQFAPPLGTTAPQAATLQISAGAGPGGAASVSLQGKPTAPLSIDRAVVPFGDVAQGATSTPLQLLTVTNVSTSAIGPLALTLSNPIFRGKDTCTGATLLGGGAGTCQITLALSPTATTPLGAVSATLSVDGTGAAATNSPATATLNGKVVSPAQIVLSPAGGFDFGTVLLKGSSAHLIVTATNAGGAPTGALAAATLGGTDPGQFIVTSDQCKGQVLASMTGSCSVYVDFLPLTAGPKQAWLSLSGNPGGTSNQVTLTGAGLTPSPLIGITPATALSAPVVLGTKYANGAGTLIDPTGQTDNTDHTTFTVANSGTAPTGSLSLALSSTVGLTPWFLANDGCSGHAVAPKSSCTFDIQFTPHPINVGPNDVAITVTDPAEPSSAGVIAYATASGIYPTGTLVISPATADFGPVSIASGRAAKMMITVTNYGLGNQGGLTDILIVNKTGGFYDFAFQGIGNCPNSSSVFAPFQTCSFPMTFAPIMGDPSTVTATLELEGKSGGTGKAGITAQSNLQGTPVP